MDFGKFCMIVGLAWLLIPRNSAFHLVVVTGKNFLAGSTWHCADGKSHVRSVIRINIVCCLVVVYIAVRGLAFEPTSSWW